MDPTYQVKINEVQKAHERLKNVIVDTPLMHDLNQSEKHNANILLKREDLQIVRSYKIRGAYNKIAQLDKKTLSKGIVCASAGNHAQGVAYSCRKLNIKGTIFMPTPTPKQKIKQVEFFGRQNIEIILTGDTYDDAYNAAMQHVEKHKLEFIHPFDDPHVIEGQATIALEILADTHSHIDFLFIPIGGGGLAAGVGSVFKLLSPDTKIIGIEPAGAPSMKEAIKEGKVVKLDDIDKFVDGAAVQQVGHLTFTICQRVLDDIILVPEGKVCSTILQLYNEEAIVVEPAGALSIAALDLYKEQIKGKNVVCIVSGSNNDITRTEEIKERSLLYEGLKHYFIVRFPQRPGAFREFLENVLGPTDDITYFQYSKKNNRELGPAVVGIELQNKEDFDPLVKKMKELNFFQEYLNDKPDLFNFLI
ncbi:MAG: threonine ammonia-lyase [Bacteroidales bacterium]|nr:threonine ammonia-lyase [Bacteroidales bacterium]